LKKPTLSYGIIGIAVAVGAIALMVGSASLTAYAQNTTNSTTGTTTTAAQQVINDAKAECASGVSASYSGEDVPSEVISVIAESCLSLVYESQQTVVFTADLLVSTSPGLYADNPSIWKAVDGFKAQGYSDISSILVAGQGSQGNPHKVYVVMSK
jgi:hypothetical protein